VRGSRHEEINLCTECQDKIDDAHVKMLKDDSKGPEYFDKCLKDKTYYCRANYDADKIGTTTKKRPTPGAAGASSPSKKPKNMMAFLLEETEVEVKEEDRRKKEAKEAAAEAQEWFEQDTGVTHSLQSIDDNGPGKPFVPQTMVAHVVQGDEQAVRLTWDASDIDNGSPIMRFVLEKRVGANPWQSAGTCAKAEHLLNGLDPDETYSFRVQAKNAHGAGSFCLATAPFSYSENITSKRGAGKVAAKKKTTKGKATNEPDGLVHVPIEIEDELEIDVWKLAVITTLGSSGIGTLSVSGEGPLVGVNINKDVNYRPLADKRRMVGIRVAVVRKDLEGAPELSGKVTNYRPTTNKHEITFEEAAMGGNKAVFDLSRQDWRYA